MAPVDAAWLHMDRPDNELIVNAVLWFADELPDELVREAVEERLVARHRRFAQRVDDSGTAAWWVDEPDFDPMAHVLRERLAEPGDLAQLSAHVTALVAQGLPRDAPLWRFHILDGYRGGTALVARMHHCIADGVALFRVLLGMSDEDQRGRLAAAPDDATAGKAASGNAASGNAASGNAASGKAAFRDAKPSLVRTLTTVTSGIGKTARALSSLVLLPPDRRTSLRDPLSGGKTLRWSDPMPLDAVKGAARAAGATVNDIVLAALSDALSRYLGDTAGPARDVRAVLPVNLRKSDADGPDLGNHFGLVFLRLPTATTDDDSRLATIRRRTSVLKASATPIVALHILRVAGRLHERAVRALIMMFSAKASVVVTNVRGPSHALHLGGHRLGGVIAWPPQSGTISTGVAVISYAGNIVVGIMTDDCAVPDSSRLLADLTSALQSVGADCGEIA